MMKAMLRKFRFSLLGLLLFTGIIGILIGGFIPRPTRIPGEEFVKQYIRDQTPSISPLVLELISASVEIECTRSGYLESPRVYGPIVCHTSTRLPLEKGFSDNDFYLSLLRKSGSPHQTGEEHFVAIICDYHEFFLQDFIDAVYLVTDNGKVYYHAGIEAEGMQLTPYSMTGENMIMKDGKPFRKIGRARPNVQAAIERELKRLSTKSLQ